VSTCWFLTVEPAKEGAKSKGLRPSDELMYLSKILNFEVSFSDYPKVSV